ncbi:LCP family protein [Thermoactinospora rubra]|uniref:LCP family protein n=1 Tax=Thermoactinospora rubra TaxID=1088767 RepID=UPI001F0A232C|nr:LCP family protein [Thermoactinospora rubra]
MRERRGGGTGRGGRAGRSREAGQGGDARRTGPGEASGGDVRGLAGAAPAPGRDASAAGDGTGHVDDARAPRHGSHAPGGQADAAGAQGPGPGGTGATDPRLDRVTDPGQAGASATAPGGRPGRRRGRRTRSATADPASQAGTAGPTSRPRTPRSTSHAAAAGSASAPGTPGHPGSAGPASGSKDAARRPRRPLGFAPRFAQPITLGSILGWTALSAIVPGLAHLRAGRRRTGFALLAAFGVLLVAGLTYGLTRNLDDLTAFATGGALVTVSVVAGLGALAWFALVLTSYIVLGPDRLDSRGQIVSGILVGVLCVAVMAPFGLVVNTAMTARDLMASIFKEGGSDPDVQKVAEPEKDPWNGRTRVNFLLVGGDGAGNRVGIRTDSMTVASVDVRTGNTVMFSLPRNLQHVHFPPNSPLAKQFPNGFMAELPNGGLLNEVWQFANDHPEIMGGRNKGPRALMDAIGHTLGLHIDYYALINMYGFVDLVDAIGGIKIRVERDIPWGGLYGTAGTIKAGYRRLSGEEALWYGRSRVGSDDFSRMSRQRCVIGAFVQQATPDKIIGNFTKIASATKRLAQTNIPQELVPAVAKLAVKVKSARITSLQFVPPEFWPGSADWAKIRRAASKAIQDSMKPARRKLAANVSAAPGSPTASPSVSPTRKPAPSQTPTRNDNKSAKSLEELCGM